MRRATVSISLDANHRSIVAELRSLGVEVVEIMEPVDILLEYRGRVMFVELKTESRNARYLRSQLTFLSQTRCPATIAKTASEAFEAVRTGIGLSQKQKDALAGFLARETANRWGPAPIEKVLGIKIREKTKWNR